MHRDDTSKKKLKNLYTPHDLSIFNLCPRIIINKPKPVSNVSFRKIFMELLKNVDPCVAVSP